MSGGEKFDDAAQAFVEGRAPGPDCGQTKQVPTERSRADIIGQKIMELTKGDAMIKLYAEVKAKRS